MFKSINGGKLPERATKYSAGFDVFSNEDVVIGAGETVLVGLGICLDWNQIDLIALGNLDCNSVVMMQNYYLELHPRSSLRAKGLGGGVGIIDIDYRHEIKMVISNPIVGLFYQQGWDRYDLLEEYKIKKGDKIGQLILKRHEGYLMPLEYTKDEQRSGGFGSTDKKGGIL